MFNIKNTLGILLIALVVSFIAPQPAYAAGAGQTSSGYHNCISAGGSDGASLFVKLRCKAATTLNDVRSIVYVLGGLGLVAFAFAAIFGKINFGHLANIGIGLFLVAVMGPFIAYFAGTGSDGGLKFDDYLPYEYTAVSGDGSYDPGCMKDANGKCDESGLNNKVNQGQNGNGSDTSGGSIKDKADQENGSGNENGNNENDSGDDDDGNQSDKENLENLKDLINQNPGRYESLA